MTSLRPFTIEDLWTFNKVYVCCYSMCVCLIFVIFLVRNLDPLTENYHPSFYLQYLYTWPEYFTVAESSSGDLMGYGA